MALLEQLVISPIPCRGNSLDMSFDRRRCRVLVPGLVDLVTINTVVNPSLRHVLKRYFSGGGTRRTQRRVLQPGRRRDGWPPMLYERDSPSTSRLLGSSPRQGFDSLVIVFKDTTGGTRRRRSSYLRSDARPVLIEDRARLWAFVMSSVEVKSFIDSGTGRRQPPVGKQPSPGFISLAPHCPSSSGTK